MDGWRLNAESTAQPAARLRDSAVRKKGGGRAGQPRNPADCTTGEAGGEGSSSTLFFFVSIFVAIAIVVAIAIAAAVAVLGWLRAVLVTVNEYAGIPYTKKFVCTCIFVTLKPLSCAKGKEP